MIILQKVSNEDERIAKAVAEETAKKEVYKKVACLSVLLLIGLRKRKSRETYERVKGYSHTL